MTKIDISPKYDEVKPQDYYVYVYKKKSSGDVFYIGKGKGRRAWDFSRGRNKHTKRTARKHGVIVEILRQDMTECCALTLEKVAIHIYGLDSLTNICSGGLGSSGYVTPDDVRKKQSLAKKGKSRGPLPQYVKDKISASHMGIRPSEETLVKLRDSHLGQRMRHDNNKFDPVIRSFMHKDHGGFIGVQYDLRMKYNLSAPCVTSLIQGKRISVKGWTYLGVIEEKGE